MMELAYAWIVEWFASFVLHEYPYAYYAHCSVHQLQLTRVSSAKVVVDVYAFYFKI